MKRRTYGTGTLRKLPSGKWLLEYKPKWASKRQSKTVDASTEKAAQRLLSDWITELDGRDGPQIEVSIHDLIDLHTRDMRVRGRDPANIDHVQKRAEKHLGSHFNKVDFARPLKQGMVTEYAESRLMSGAARATINRELSALRRGLQVAVNEGLINVPLPRLEKLQENNTRTGFVEDEAYCAILKHLPEHQQAVWCYAYRLGIRKGQLLKLRSEWVLPYWGEPEPYIKVPGFDADGRRITKNGKPHTIPLYHPDLRAFTEMVLARRDAKCPYLFQYRGKRLKNIRTGFEQACKAAGYPKMIFHDTRRSAVKRMEDAGIPRREAMQITGHATESVYKRYDIGSEKGAIEAGRKLREFEQRKPTHQSANKFANEDSKAESGSVN
jgi:integrase